MCAPSFAKGQRVEVFSKSQGQWLPAVIEKVYAEQTVENGRSVPAGCLLVTSAAGRKYILADQISTTVRSSASSSSVAKEEVHAFTDASLLKPGDRVEVFSESQGRWLPATVEAVFAEATTENGYTIPAGCVRVKSASGSKYVPAEHMSTTLRKIKPCPDETIMRKPSCNSSDLSSRRTSGGFSFLSLASVQSGDKVEVFSNSQRMWLPAEVEEKYERDTLENGRKIPAGCLRIKSSAGSKYVPAEMIETVLRGPPPEGLPWRFETLRPGDKVEVYSNSKGQWLPGEVEEVYHRDILQGTQTIPAGCIRVRSSAGMKCIPADKLAEMLRPAKGTANVTPRPCPDCTIGGVGGA